MSLYEIAFAGQVVSGAPLEQVKANLARLFQADAAAVVVAADPAQGQAQVADRVARRGVGLRQAAAVDAGGEQQFIAIDMDAVAGTQHRQLADGPAIDVHAPGVGQDVHPHATLVNHQFDQGGFAQWRDTQPTLLVRIATERGRTRGECKVGVGVVGEAEDE